MDLPRPHTSMQRKATAREMQSDYDQLTERMADFRRRRNQGPFNYERTSGRQAEEGQTDTLENSANTYQYNSKLLTMIFALLALVPVMFWIFSQQRAYQPPDNVVATIDENRAKIPNADNRAGRLERFTVSNEKATPATQAQPGIAGGTTDTPAAADQALQLALLATQIASLARKVEMLERSVGQIQTTLDENARLQERLTLIDVRLARLAAGLESPAAKPTNTLPGKTDSGTTPDSGGTVAVVGHGAKPGTAATPGNAAPAREPVPSVATTPVQTLAGKPSPPAATVALAPTNANDISSGKTGPKIQAQNARITPAESQKTPSATSTTRTSPSGGTWNINLLSSTDRNDAKRFSNRMQSRGLDTEVQEVTVKGTRYWRVQITGFHTRAAARDHATQIRNRLGLKDTWVMQN